jgi:hypothetical protein
MSTDVSEVRAASIIRTISDRVSNYEPGIFSEIVKSGKLTIISLCLNNELIIELKNLKKKEKNDECVSRCSIVK